MPLNFLKLIKKKVRITSLKTYNLQENRSQQTEEIDILEHSEANASEKDQCSSIIGECIKQCKRLKLG